MRGPPAARGGDRQRLSVEARREVLSRARAGEPASVLAAAYGITPRAIQRIVREESGETATKMAGSAVVATRLSRDELQAFLGLAATAGYASRSQALRALIRMAGGLVELGPGDLGVLRQAAWMVGKQGVLLNQLARAVHTGKLRLTEADRKVLRDTMETCRGVEAALAEAGEAAGRRGARVRRGLTSAGTSDV